MENDLENLKKFNKKDLTEFIIKNNYIDQYNKFIRNKYLDKSNITLLNDLQVNQKTIHKDQKRLDFKITKHFAFKFGYFGKNYEGLVFQKHTTNTVEDKIINSLKKANFIENFENCNYSRCGRTDAGVSAVGNVFSVTLRLYFI
jgi:tRNA pseudouridine38/39 synthase